MAHMSSVQNPVLSLFRFTPAVSSRVGETITRPHSVSKDNRSCRPAWSTPVELS